MATNGKHHRKRRTKEETEKLARMARRLMESKLRPLTVKQTAAKLGVLPTWIYYHVGAAREFRAA